MEECIYYTQAGYGWCVSGYGCCVRGVGMLCRGPLSTNSTYVRLGSHFVLEALGINDFQRPSNK
jgi:hypothetical protein